MALLTLTSDIGQRDYLVAPLKGTLLQITRHSPARHHHELLPFNYPRPHTSAERHRNFPAQLIISSWSISSRKAPNNFLLAFHNQQNILCADKWPTFHDPRRPPGNGHRPPPGQDLHPQHPLLHPGHGEAIDSLLSGTASSISALPTHYSSKKITCAPSSGDNWNRRTDHLHRQFRERHRHIHKRNSRSSGKGRSFRSSSKRRVIDRSAELCRRPRREKLALFNRRRLPGDRHPERQCGRSSAPGLH